MSEGEDTIIDLSFVPAWARQPANKNPYTDFSDRSGGRRDDGRDFKRRDAGMGNRDVRRPKDSRARPSAPPGTSSISSPSTGAGAGSRPDQLRFADKPRFNAERPRPPVRPLRVHVPVDIAFIPERHGLKPLAMRLARTKRAYSLLEVASMFLTKPEYYAVKIEAKPESEGGTPITLFQCLECQAVFLDRDQTITHAFSKHFEAFYEKTQVAAEPPKGNFVCVARCGLSNQLLGPPNYHGYNDKVAEIHRTLFPHMTIEEYRKKIVNDSSPELLEQWKQQSATQTIYNTKRAEPAASFTRLIDVEAHFAQQHVPALVREGHRFIIPGRASQVLDDAAMRHTIHDAWNRENRFPLKMVIALHPAFRHLGLHIFKAPDRTTFVTSIHPSPIDPAKTTDVLREILEYLCQNSGRTRQELAEALRPGAALDSPNVATLINPLRWLIEKGHVIEFYNGTLAVPYRRQSGAAPATTEPSPDTIAPTPDASTSEEPSHG